MECRTCMELPYAERCVSRVGLSNYTIIPASAYLYFGLKRLLSSFIMQGFHTQKTC